MTDSEHEALELVSTFLHTYYYDPEWDIQGTSAVLRAWGPGDPHRKALARGFRRILAAPLPQGTLTRLVQEDANRRVHTDDEARAYLQYLYEDTHLDWEEDEDEDG